VTTASGHVALDDLNLTRSESAAMMKGLGAPGAYLACLHATWLDAFGDEFASETGGNDHWPVWDEAVVAIVLGLTGQRELPRPAVADDTSFSFPNAKSHAPYRWVDTIDRARLYGDLVGLVGRRGSEGDGGSPAPGGPSAAAADAPPARCVGWMCREPCPVPGG
jgi:hypothetical protein